MRRRSNRNALWRFMLWALLGWLQTKAPSRPRGNPYARPSDRKPMQRRLKNQQKKTLKGGGGGGGGGTAHPSGEKRTGSATKASKSPEQKSPIYSPDTDDEILDAEIVEDVEDDDVLIEDDEAAIEDDEVDPEGWEVGSTGQREIEAAPAAIGAGGSGE